MSKKLGQLREAWVLQTEENIQFGTGQKWADVEADEATFDKKIVNGQLQWEQWCGIVQRGRPHTLVLHRLKPLASKLRAPGPGAVRKVEWKPIAAKWLQDREVILHTDSAKSYATKVSGVLHDRVVHKKKLIKVNGKFKSVAPKYFQIKQHKIPGRKKCLKVKSGTQIIDRCWQYLKDRVNINQHSKVDSHSVALSSVRVLAAGSGPVDCHWLLGPMVHVSGLDADGVCVEENALLLISLQLSAASVSCEHTTG